jgi:hypothetical protein
LNGIVGRYIVSGRLKEWSLAIGEDEGRVSVIVWRGMNTYRQVQHFVGRYIYINSFRET